MFKFNDNEGTGVFLPGGGIIGYLNGGEGAGGGIIGYLNGGEGAGVFFPGTGGGGTKGCLFG